MKIMVFICGIITLLIGIMNTLQDNGFFYLSKIAIGIALIILSKDINCTKDVAEEKK